MADSRDLKAPNPWANLVMAMLSVNSFSLEKTFELYDQLGANGLFDPHNLASFTHLEIFNKLVASGYKRGDFIVGIVTIRLLSLGSYFSENIQNMEQILASGNEKEVKDLLSQVKGLGAVTIQNYLSLRNK